MKKTASRDKVDDMKTPRTIIQIDKDASNPLRRTSEEVKRNEFGKEELKKMIADMRQALAKEKDGVALAAPQLGISKRIFVLSPDAYEEDAKWKPLVFINPVLTKVSKLMEERQEGCLSVRWVYGKTHRHARATVEAYDEHGTKFSFGGTGLVAHIFQHEIDHLDGILFIDHGYDFEEYTEEEIMKAAEKKQP
jgi:peptide deformylase